MDNAPNEIKTRSRSNTTMLAIAIVLAIVVIGLVIMLVSTRTNLKSLLAEKEQQRLELKQELDSVLVEHEKVKVE